MKLMLCRDPLKWGWEHIGWIPSSDRLRFLDNIGGIRLAAATAGGKVGFQGKKHGSYQVYLQDLGNAEAQHKLNSCTDSKGSATNQLPPRRDSGREAGP